MENPFVHDHGITMNGVHKFVSDLGLNSQNFDTCNYWPINVRNNKVLFMQQSFCFKTSPARDQNCAGCGPAYTNVAAMKTRTEIK
jgi:hypothetical protein